jgi:hypothetical protein
MNQFKYAIYDRLQKKILTIITVYRLDQKCQNLKIDFLKFQNFENRFLNFRKRKILI